MRTKTTLLLLFIVACTVSVHAKGPYNDSGRNRGNYSNEEHFEFSYIPNLHPKQKYMIREICLERDRKVYKLNARKMELTMQLMQMKKSPYSKPRSIEKTRNQIFDLEKSINSEHYKAESKIYSLLNHRQRLAYESSIRARYI